MTAAYMALVCFNNISDYGSNFAFVQNVSGMTDVFDPALTGWRSLQAPWMHHALYLCIILTELLIAGLLLRGAFNMWRVRRADVATFQASTRWAIIGLGIGVILWFFGFIAVGGEWFLMWQSSKWNGQDNAFSLAIVFLLLLNWIGRSHE